jgi:hypothetical protein
MMKDVDVLLTNYLDGNYPMHARRELPRAMTDADVPAVAALAFAGDYHDESYAPEGSGDPSAHLMLPRKEFYRHADEMARRQFYREVLRDYYFRAGSPAARDAFMAVLRRDGNRNAGVLKMFFEQQEVPATGAPPIDGQVPHVMRLAFLPGVRNTDWEEAVHREYPKFTQLEASLEAAWHLYLGGKYRDEAVWLLCRVLADERLAVSLAEVEMMEYLTGHRAKPREYTVATALTMLDELTRFWQDRETRKLYVIPWAKHLLNRGDVAADEARHTLEPKETDALSPADVQAIAAGTPVPPKPSTAAE